MKEAMLYKQMKDKKVQCHLCKRYCIINEGEVGFCRVRKNIDGKLYSLVYGKAVAWHVDPIEKKPFYNFLPGTMAYSIATVGCNFRCLHCQNWDISQPTHIFGEDLPPEKVVENALSMNVDGIAYTYTEPTIFFEYAYDTARFAYSKKLYNVFVTNGYMSDETINKMDYIDASRVDLKAFTEKFYQEICGNAHLNNVLNTIKELYKKQHIEIITLLIPTLNDSPDEIRELARWVKSIDKKIPLHFTAYYPANKMTLPPTPLRTLQEARKIALDEGLDYVYTGNIPGDEGESTYCPECGSVVIKRYGFTVLEKNYVETDDGYAVCKRCGAKLNIVTNLEKYRERRKRMMKDEG